MSGDSHPPAVDSPVVDIPVVDIPVVDIPVVDIHAQSLAAWSAARAAEWRPGLAGDGAAHAEVFASGRDVAGAALALALAQDRLRVAGADPLAQEPGQRAWLWVQDAAAIRLTGRPCRAGLPAALRHRLIHVAARTPEDALFALEEGLRCRDLAFAIGEIAGNPRALGLTASRRLGLMVERHGVPLWLVRIDARRDLGSARMRWQAASAPSPPPRWNAQGPGTASWRAELFRARTHPCGEWILRDDGQTLLADRVPPSAPLAAAAPHPGDLADAAGAGSLAAG